MTPRSIEPICGPFDSVLHLAGAKSICNRALVAAALARGRSLLSNFLFSDDTLHMIAGLEALGIRIAADRAGGTVEINGSSGHPPECSADIDCGESGTMLRFFAALCATQTGEYRLSGRGRLHDRPLAPLIDALRRQGALIECEQREGHAPILIRGRGLSGGRVDVDGSQSSQFASALLLAAPGAVRDLMLAVSGRPVSRPYLRLTRAVMDTFGVASVSEDDVRVIVPAPQMYEAANLAIEPDASSAGYFLAAAALCGGRVRIADLPGDSVQADLCLVELLRRMGCEVKSGDDGVEVGGPPGTAGLRAIDADLADAPDAAPTVAVLALFARGQTRLSGIGHVQYKESPRLDALADVLTRLGAEVVRHDDGLSIRPPQRVRGGELDAGGDHRLAMALSLVGLAVPGVRIIGAECVNKSCPGYFEVLEQLSGIPRGR